VRVSVLVPTYRRPQDLRRCLDALAAQNRMADENVVIVRDSDEETWKMLENWNLTRMPVRTITVTEPGTIQALNAGLNDVQTDIIAITDDDAAPLPDWVERVVAHFEQDPRVGGVGGRDYMRVGGVLQEGSEAIVGKVPLIGKHVGNHHLGFGEPREVDALKGVNGSYRVEAIRPIGFDTRLRGTGAQVYWEISLGLALKRAGWKLIYDPLVAVDHFQAPRFDEDQRSGFNALATENLTYNETLIRLDQLSRFGGLVYLGWAILIGTRVTPGLVQWVRFAPFQGSLAGARFQAALAGRLKAWKNARAAVTQRASRAPGSSISPNAH
jgi:glycosyltransferase involved in cell wall biosynthesis